MSKEWTFIGSNSPVSRTKEEDSKYYKKQFKWGMKLDKMAYNKPKVNYKKEDITPDEEE